MVVQRLLSRSGMLCVGGALGFFAAHWHSQRHATASTTPSVPFDPRKAVTPNVAEPATRVVPYGYPDTGQFKFRDGYILSYNTRLRNANWACEHITKNSIRIDKNQPSDRSKCHFVEDPSVHPFFRSTDADYKRSGYDRGHLVAAADQRRSQQAMQDTFYFTNMSPQVGKGFNRDAWAKLESYVRSLANLYDDVYVCTGPLFLPRMEADGNKYVRYKVIGPNNVAVPTHFYKVVLGQSNNRKPEIQVFLMPNEEIKSGRPLSEFLVPLETIEKNSGFLFYDKLPNKYDHVMRDNNGRLAGRFRADDTT